MPAGKFTPTSVRPSISSRRSGAPSPSACWGSFTTSGQKEASDRVAAVNVATRGLTRFAVGGGRRDNRPPRLKPGRQAAVSAKFIKTVPSERLRRTAGSALRSRHSRGSFSRRRYWLRCCGLRPVFLKDVVIALLLQLRRQRPHRSGGRCISRCRASSGFPSYRAFDVSPDSTTSWTLCGGMNQRPSRSASTGASPASSRFALGC